MWPFPKQSNNDALISEDENRDHEVALLKASIDVLSDMGFDVAIMGGVL